MTHSIDEFHRDTLASLETEGEDGAVMAGSQVFVGGGVVGVGGSRGVVHELHLRMGLQPGRQTVSVRGMSIDAERKRLQTYN